MTTGIVGANGETISSGQDEQEGQEGAATEQTAEYEYLFVQAKGVPIMYTFKMDADRRAEAIARWKNGGIIELEAKPGDGKFFFNAAEIIYMKETTAAEFDALNAMATRARMGLGR